jgi:hypothetical protein
VAVGPGPDIADTDAVVSRFTGVVCSEEDTAGNWRFLMQLARVNRHGAAVVAGSAQRTWVPAADAFDGQSYIAIPPARDGYGRGRERGDEDRGRARVTGAPRGVGLDRYRRWVRGPVAEARALPKQSPGGRAPPAARL